MSTIKKYMLFAISFVLLFSLFQVFSGLFLTLAYTPDMEEAWNMSAGLPQETVITSGSSPFFLTLLLAFGSATTAYVISQKMAKNKNSQ